MIIGVSAKTISNTQVYTQTISGYEIKIDIYNLPGLGGLEDYVVSINNSKQISLRNIVNAQGSGYAGPAGLTLFATATIDTNGIGSGETDITCYRLYIDTANFSGSSITIELWSRLGGLAGLGIASIPITVSINYNKGNIRLPSQTDITMANLFYLVGYIEYVIAIIFSVYLIIRGKWTYGLWYLVLDLGLLTILGLNNGYATILADTVVGYLELREVRLYWRNTLSYSLGYGRW